MNVILYLTYKKLAGSGPVIIPYKEINRLFITLFGIITGSLPGNYPCARCKIVITRTNL